MNRLSLESLWSLWRLNPSSNLFRPIDSTRTISVGCCTSPRWAPRRPRASPPPPPPRRPRPRAAPTRPRWSSTCARWAVPAAASSPGSIRELRRLSRLGSNPGPAPCTRAPWVSLHPGRPSHCAARAPRARARRIARTRRRASRAWRRWVGPPRPSWRVQRHARRRCRLTARAPR